jgi:hypothetical protein
MYIIPLGGGGNPKAIFFHFLATTNNMAEMQTKKLIYMSCNNNTYGNCKEQTEK